MLAVAIFASCSGRPSDVLSDSEMEDLLTDLQLAGAYSNRNVAYSSDTMRMMLVNYVLDKHGVSQEQLDSTLSWYARNMDDYDKVLDKVDKRLAALQKSSASGVEDLNSDNLWPYLPHVIVTEEGRNNGMSFNISSSDIETGGVVRWEMRFTPTPRLSVLLGVEYDNGKKEYVEKLVMGNKKLALELQTDSSLSVNRVFGNLAVVDSNNLPVWVDSISVIALPLTRVTYYRRNNGVRTYEKPERKQEKKDTTNTTDSLKNIGSTRVSTTTFSESITGDR